MAAFAGSGVNGCGVGGSWVNKTIFWGFGGGLHLGGVGCGVEYAFIFFSLDNSFGGFCISWGGL